MADRHRQPDGAAPVLAHQGDALQAELGHESFHHAGVFGDGVAVAGGRGGEPESRVVEGEAAELVLEPVDDVPVEKRPGRIAVQPENDRPLAFVEVMNLCPVDLHVVAVEGEQLLIHPGGPGRHGCLPEVGFRAVSLKLGWPLQQRQDPDRRRRDERPGCQPSP
jgi:hypothetical protein